MAMDLESIRHKLEEAKESKDWDLVQEAINTLRELTDNPFDEYEVEDDLWG